jgi:polysaccharide biosynthesis protein PslE
MKQDTPFDPKLPVPSNVPAPPALNLERIHLIREDSPANGLRDYLSIFFKHKLGVLVSFLILGILSVAGVLIYSYFIYTPLFEARSLVLVKAGWENNSPEYSLESQRKANFNMTDLISSEARILDSRELKARVVNSLKPENIFPDLVKNPIPGLSNNEAALVMLEKDLSVISGKTLSVPAVQLGNVIEVIFGATDPARAAAVVNQLVSFYIEKRSEIYKDPKSVLFLEKKADEFRQKLADAENRMKTFREETKIVSFDEQRTMLLKQKSTLAGDLDGTANQIKEVQEKISELERQLASVAKTATTSVAAERRADAESRLLLLQLQEKELVAKYKEDNRLVANVREQIKMVQEHLEAQAKKPGAAIPDPVYQDIQKQVFQNKAELSALKIRKTGVEQQLQELNDEFQTFEAMENRNKTLLSDISSNDEKYRTYRQRLEEAKIYDELDRQKMTSVSVIEPAAAPAAPVNPPKPLILLIPIAIVGSILGSLGIALLMEVLKHGVSTPTEVEKRLGLPVLVAIAQK